jgi:hypothetical protein
MSFSNTSPDGLPSLRTPEGFLADRAEYFGVAVVPRLTGSDGWDVVLRLDGSYTDRSDAEQVRNDLALKVCQLVQAMAMRGELDRSVAVSSLTEQARYVPKLKPSMD